jgi:hypothetical protein
MHVLGGSVATLLSGVCADVPILDCRARLTVHRWPLAVTPISEVTLYGCMYASRACIEDTPIPV